MKIRVLRYEFGECHTVGELWVDNIRLGYTLEDKVRVLNSASDKVHGRTAIPYGEYEVDMNTPSPRFSRSATYKDIGGLLPRLKNVPYFDGVLIHVGCYSTDTEGCLLVGETHIAGRDFIGNSKKCFFRLYNEFLRPAYLRGERITIQITKK